MATRVVTGTVLRANGAPWAGASVKFRPVDDSYTLAPDTSYPITTVLAVTDSDGEFSVTLAAGLSVAYQVDMPDGETFRIVVSEGSATTLELLRAAYDGANPAALPTLDLIVAETVENSAEFSTLLTDIVEGIIETVVNESAAVKETIEDYLSASIPDSDTIDATYNDGTGVLDLEVKPNTTQQKVGVRKNSTGSTHVRQRVNFIEGSNVTLTVSDDAGSDEVDVTIAASGGSTIAVKEANSDVVAAASAIDFDGSDFNVTDAGSGRAVIELAGTLGGSIELKEDNVQVIAAMTALDFDGDHFNVADSGSGRGTITLVNPMHTVTKSLNFPFGDEDGLGAVVATTARRTISIPVGWGTCTITRWRVLADQSTTATLDVWRDSYANYPPTNADSITASAKPATSAAAKAESASLTGWTTTFSGGDVLTAEIEANSAAKWLLLVLEFTMTAV